MNLKLVWGVVLVFIVVGAGIFLINNNKPQGSTTIRFGMSPYQDTAIPVLSEAMGLYKQNGMNVELVNVPYENVITSLASAGETIDVGINDVGSFLPRAQDINVKGGGDVVFYAPLYVFKGASLMTRKELKLKTLSDFTEVYPNDRDKAITETMKQLKGKRVGVPKGSVYEQMLVSTLKTAGMTTKDIDLRYVNLADALPAFLSGNLDVIGAGVTQRTEAERYGHKALLDSESMGFASIDGLMTTKRFADAHPKEMQKLVDIWFQTINKLSEDVPNNSKPIRDWLTQKASTNYSPEEYKNSLTWQEFPKSRAEATALMNKPEGKFYWQRAWDILNDFLVNTHTIEQAIPYSYYLGNSTL